mmetsp:Transcript_16028/g.37017  ORF Transcript_16028/g.37017 Transcript_16028/m.37017 type:complete len:190 (+) Transcript_16028:144-713(+)
MRKSIHRKDICRITWSIVALLPCLVLGDLSRECEITVQHSFDAHKTCTARMEGARLECATYVEGQSEVAVEGRHGEDGKKTVWRAEAGDPRAFFHCRMVGGGLSSLEQQALTNLQCGATIGCSRETVPVEVTVERTDDFDAWGRGLLEEQLAGSLGGDVEVMKEWEVFPGRCARKAFTWRASCKAKPLS